MSADYLRLCPTCGTENSPETLRCACGALLSGVDIIARVALAEAAAASPGSEASLPPAATIALQPEAPPASPSAPQPITCPHADCGQPNPPGSPRCLYCDRPLLAGEEGDGLTAAGPQAGGTTLLALPGALRQRFRIVRALPASGAEAELLVVEPLAGGEQSIAKIYRHGIHPKPEVQERLRRIPRAHCVEMLESGVSDGFAFERMEFCRQGSLRQLLAVGPPNTQALHHIIEELAAAIAAVHEAGLTHRDLKPENILVRQTEPLDLVLADFGIASLQDASLRFTGMARTLAYGSPESLSGVISGKTDYWSLGMILLEAALGQHPFAGLSDAVILHRLATRSIDLAAVADPALKKLLRGLLLRDPKARWGAGEVGRWLAGDATLAEPASEQAVSSHRPYRLGNEECATPEQLAVALTRHWDKGVADLDNGLLMAWFRDELKDQNLVRLMIDLKFDRQLPADIRLLRLMLDLAPGLPPVWKGAAADLGSILRHADRALRGEAEAAAWLDEVFQQRVMEAYAAAGNPEAADLVQRWHDELGRFNAAWKTLLERLREADKPGPEHVVLFDDVMYGRNGPLRPSPHQLHPRLLALAYDEAWAGRLRQRLQAELAHLGLALPWAAELGSPAEMASHELLALDALLPELKKAAGKEAGKRQQAADAEAGQMRELEAQARLAIATLRGHADTVLLTTDTCAALRQALDDYFGLYARIRGLGRSDAPFLQLRSLMGRYEPIASRLIRLVDELVERRAVNRGWFDQQVLASFGLALFLVPLVFNERLFYPLLLGGLAIALWRLLPNFFTARQIRRLARQLGGP